MPRQARDNHRENSKKVPVFRTVASPGLAKAVVRPASDGRTGRAVLAAPEDARAAGATHRSCRRFVTTKAVAHVPLSRRWCLLVLFLLLLLLLVWHCRRRRRWRRRRRRAASDSNLIGASSFLVFALVWRRRLVLSSNLLDELCGKRALFWSFPYVCPEPVLAKR